MKDERCTRSKGTSMEERGAESFRICIIRLPMTEAATLIPRKRLDYRSLIVAAP